MANAFCVVYLLDVFILHFYYYFSSNVLGFGHSGSNLPFAFVKPTLDEYKRKNKEKIKIIIIASRHWLNSIHQFNFMIITFETLCTNFNACGCGCGCGYAHIFIQFYLSRQLNQTEKSYIYFNARYDTIRYDYYYGSKWWQFFSIWFHHVKSTFMLNIN